MNTNEWDDFERALASRTDGPHADARGNDSRHRA
jgi:hypothetical protein